jgi:hypothetical protein
VTIRWRLNVNHHPAIYKLVVNLFGCRSDRQVRDGQSLQQVAAAAVRRIEMGPGFAVNAFVPIWIFAPILLIGIVGWFITPTPTASRLSGTLPRSADSRLDSRVDLTTVRRA